MENSLRQVLGKVHSIQSMGTVDGPGVRFVVFTQGCNLRCGCCHNPDTWQKDESKIFSAGDIVDKASRYREYFGKDGGITISGGEPLLQPEFCNAIFTLSRERGLNTCLDTSGSILNDKVKSLLKVTDRALLDIKYTNDADYIKYAGCSINKPLEFLEYLQQQNIPTVIRQVIIPTLNDSEQNILTLKNLLKSFSVVEKIELLPFRKICQVKYDKLGLDFPFKHLSEPTNEQMNILESLL